MNATSAIFATGIPCAAASTICARRQVITGPLSPRMIRSRRCPLVVIDLADAHPLVTGTAFLPRAAGECHAVGVPMRRRLPSGSRSSISRAQGASLASTPNSEAMASTSRMRR